MDYRARNSWSIWSGGLWKRTESFQTDTAIETDLIVNCFRKWTNGNVRNIYIVVKFRADQKCSSGH